MLHALELPSRGGVTCFTNQTAAYEALDDAQQRELAALVGKHIYLSRFSKRRLQAMTPDEIARAPSASHPLVRPHPVTGRPALFFNPVRIEEFEGMSPEASQDLIHRLIEHCEQPRFVYRHQWRQGDVLIWDNRQALHMVEHDYPKDELRLMHRTLVGSEALAETMGSTLQ